MYAGNMGVMGRVAASEPTHLPIAGTYSATSVVPSTAASV